MDKSAPRLGPAGKPPRSLRRVALIVTGISGGIALVAGMITWFVEESSNPMHPLGNAGWLAFSAGFVAIGGLITVLIDVLIRATTPSGGQSAAAPPRAGRPRPVRTVRRGVLAYAICLLIGALGVIAYGVYRLGWGGLGEGGFLLLCAAAFLWGVLGLRRSAVSPGSETLPDEVPGRSAAGGVGRQVLRQWGLAFTGVGAGIAVVMLWYSAFINHFFWSGMLFGPAIFAGFGSLAAAGGLVLLIVDGLLRLTGRRY